MGHADCDPPDTGRRSRAKIAEPRARDRRKGEGARRSRAPLVRSWPRWSSTVIGDLVLRANRGGTTCIDELVAYERFVRNGGSD